MKYERKRDGVYYFPAFGRVMEHHRYVTKIFWNATMLDYLKKNFATTLNEELAGWLGVSQRTMSRKASELGLEKDKEWLRAIWEERRRMAHTVLRVQGNAGQFKPGHRANPANEFKPGHQLTPEQKEKRSASLRSRCARHPKELSVRALKAWETRRLNIEH